jgi:replicative superfamily II helicase
MSGDKIKEIRKKISKSLNTKIDYEHTIIQMLKRGIGLYTKNMPEEYKWIIQTLLINKEIGIVISAKELSMGINMPIKTSCILSIDDNKFNASEFLQMSGRAGRRGYDTSGNIIFINVDYKNLIKSELPDIYKSSDKLYTHYNIINKINHKVKGTDVFKNLFNKDRRIISTKNINNEDKKYNNIIWYLRNYEHYDIFIKEIKELYNLKSNLNKENLIIKQFDLLFETDTIYNCYLNNKLNSNYKGVLDIIIVLYNNLKYNEDFMNILMIIYEKLKRLINRANGFNNY